MSDFYGELSEGLTGAGELCYKLLASGCGDDGAVVAKRIVRTPLRVW